MIESDWGLAVDLLWRLTAGTVGGLLVAASVFKSLSVGDFRDWLARLFRTVEPRMAGWIARVGIAVELALGLALLLWPARLVVAIGWGFCLLLVLMQARAWAVGLGPCVCFGSSNRTRGAMIGPVLAGLLALGMSALLWFGASGANLMLTGLEYLAVTSGALEITLTILIVAEAPGQARQLRAAQGAR